MQATRNETMRRTDPISGYSYNTGGTGKAKLIVLLIVVAVVAVAATCAVFFLLSGDDSPSGGGLIIDQNAGEYVAPVIDQTVVQNVAIPGWGRLTIPAGSTQVTSVDLYNPEENAGLYYLTFELRLPSDNGDYISLYQSDAIPPGKHIQSITLSQPLDAGMYNAVIHVQPYRMSDETPTNNADMKTTLVVV